MATVSSPQRKMSLDENKPTEALALSLPIIMDYINDELGYYTLLIVSPLDSLMEDQVKKLGDLGVNAVALSDMTEGGRYEDDEDTQLQKKLMIFWRVWKRVVILLFILHQKKEDQCRFKNGIYNILVVLDEVFGDIEEDISDLDLVELSEDDENAVCPEWQCIRDDTALVNLGDSDLEVYLDSIIDKMDISAEEDSFNM
eukprot:gene12621-13911_t